MSVFAICYTILTYLIGSISSAILVSKILKLPDPRTVGSGNPGATNMLRIGGKHIGLFVLIFDILKGMLPVWLAYYLHLTNFELGLVALAACLGHIYPIYFKFHGGKGVATAFGAIAPIGWAVAFWMLAIWIVVFVLSKRSSISSVLTALLVPYIVWWNKPEFTFPVALVSYLLVYRHYDNLHRLIKGNEKKLFSSNKHI